MRRSKAGRIAPCVGGSQNSNPEDPLWGVSTLSGSMAGAAWHKPTCMRTALNPSKKSTALAALLVPLWHSYCSNPLSLKPGRCLARCSGSALPLPRLGYEVSMLIAVAGGAATPQTRPHPKSTFMFLPTAAPVHSPHIGIGPR